MARICFRTWGVSVCEQAAVKSSVKGMLIFLLCFLKITPGVATEGDLSSNVTLRDPFALRAVPNRTQTQTAPNADTKARWVGTLQKGNQQCALWQDEKGLYQLRCHEDVT